MAAAEEIWSPRFRASEDVDTQYPSGANEAELGHFVHCSQLLVLMPQFPQSFSRKLLLQHYTARAGEDSWHMPAHEQLSSFVVPKTPVQYVSQGRERNTCCKDLKLQHPLSPSSRNNFLLAEVLGDWTDNITGIWRNSAKWLAKNRCGKKSSAQKSSPSPYPKYVGCWVSATFLPVFIIGTVLRGLGKVLLGCWLGNQSSYELV